MAKKKKIILIDGNSLLYRAFFALPTTITTSNGVVTNAVYGFTSMLLKLIKDESPNCLAVAFDKGIVTLRHSIFANYKAHRPQTPSELRPQFEIIKEVLAALSIPTYEKSGYEADDILATMARLSANAGNKVVVVTGDRDAFQLISDNVEVMTTRRGITDIVIYNQKKLAERYGISPSQMPDMLGLKGDPSDNIPGVPGVGEKTATKLLQEYGNIENIYEKIDEIKGKLNENLCQFKEQAEISKKLATLHFNVPVDFDIGKCRLNMDISKAKETFLQLEFKTLLERLKKLLPEDKETAGFKPEFRSVTFEQIAPFLKKVDKIALDFITDGENIKNVLLCFKSKQQNTNVNSFSPVVYSLDFSELTKLKPYFENKHIAKLTFNAKPLIFVLRFKEMRLASIKFDAQLAAYLLEPAKANYFESDLAMKYLKIDIETNAEEKTANAILRCYLAYELEKPLLKKLKENNLEKVYQKLELPLIPVLAAMEYRGVGVDTKELKTYALELRHMLNELKEDIYRLADEEFNINSPSQLSKILFEKLKLKPIKKTKTGFSTDSSVLLRLINEHSIIENIINYRMLAKIKSTYVDALPKLVNPKTKRLHTTLNQTVTATGRLSSSNPNLQNIPIRTEVGRRLRRAFIPARKTDNLLVADYSQIELRIAAHLSHDKALCKAFKQHADIHQTTAAEVFNLPLNKVSKELRYKAKAVNFGIIYGISPFGLSQQLKISTEEAANYIELYFNRYPQIKEFIDKTIENAYKNGFVETIYGRRRTLPELTSKDNRVKNFGERSAVNSVIQGSAADIIKQAMINIENLLLADGMMSRMVLQVHDELIFEVPTLEQTAARLLIKREMEKAYPLNPSLEVNIGIGHNWLEAKSKN